MADFTNVKTSLSADGKVVTLSGQAIAPVATPVHITETVSAADGSSETLQSDGTRSINQAVKTTLTSVTDSLGNTATISADGQTATFA